MSTIPELCMALAGGELGLRFFFRAEVPTQIDVLVRPHPAIIAKEYRASISANFQDRSMRIGPFKLPDRIISTFFLGEVQVSAEDKRYRARLPTLELASKDRFLEYIITKQLERIGFECDWLSRRDPRFPDIRAIFKPEPKGDVVDVECTLQTPYDSRKLYADIGKFRSEAPLWRPAFTRLLIVPLYASFTEDVLKKLAVSDESVAVITYPDLVQLVKQVERGYMDKYRAYDLLRQSGRVQIAHLIPADATLPGILWITYSFILKSID